MRTCPGLCWENGSQRLKKKRGKKRDRGTGKEIKEKKPKGRTQSDKRPNQERRRGEKERDGK